MSKLAETLKQLRKSKGLSQKELADLTNLSVHAINSYESGRREPNSKAMAALESYFHVTGEYIRGETDSFEPQYIWQDPEAMDAVTESFPVLINKLLDSAMHSSELEQKMLFDIFVELYHMSSLKNVSPEFKKASFLLIEETFTRSTRFVDFFNRSATSEFETTRVDKYIQSCVSDYEKALNKFRNTFDETP